MKKYARRTLTFVLCSVLLFSVIGIDSGSFAMDSSTKSTAITKDSPARDKYESLLSGKYYAGELIEKFHELYGDDYTGEYIRENYSEIFDIAEDEIDEGLLNIIANPYHDHDSSVESILMENSASDAKSKYLNIDMQMDESLFSPIMRPDEVQTISPPQDAVPPIPDVINLDSTIDQKTESFLESDANSSDDLFENSEDRGQNSEAESQNAFASGDNIVYAAMPTSSGNAWTSISLVSKTNTSVTFDIWYVQSNNINNYLRKYDKYSKTFTYIYGQGNPAATSQRFTATGLQAGATYTFATGYYDTASSSWKNAEITVQTSGLKTPSLTITNNSATSFTANVTFPSEYSWGNYIKYWDGYEWIDIATPEYYAKSGSYTVTGLIPGKTYSLSMRYYNNLESYWENPISATGTTILPAENMQTYTLTNMGFSFDKWFADLFSAGRLNLFLNKVDFAYGVQYSLVGGSKPYGGDRMLYFTSRNMSTNVEGKAGQPITWSIYNPVYPVAPDHVVQMNRDNTYLTETPIHEIGHNFEKTSWNFEGEALTILKIYQYMKITGETMSIVNHNQTFTGASGYKTYMKSHADRIQGHINYDAAMAAGVYSPYSLAYRLALISDATGWEAFKLAFNDIDALPYGQAPSTSIGKFNYIMTKVRDYSGAPVLSMIPANEKAIFEAKLGGTIEYVDPVLFKQSNSEEFVLFSKADGTIANFIFYSTIKAYYRDTSMTNREFYRHHISASYAPLGQAANMSDISTTLLPVRHYNSSGTQIGMCSASSGVACDVFEPPNLWASDHVDSLTVINHTKGDASYAETSVAVFGGAGPFTRSPRIDNLGQ